MIVAGIEVWGKGYELVATMEPVISACDGEVATSDSRNVLRPHQTELPLANEAT